jgi:hypothetical protein
MTVPSSTHTVGQPTRYEIRVNIDETKHGLTVRVIWIDEELIELACTLVFGKYAGEATCYTNGPQLHDFADALSQFSATAEGEPRFESGLSDRSKACDLHAYRTDRSGHMAVHVRLAGEKVTPRAESVARMEVEMPVEAWALARFAGQLREIARTKTGAALLAHVV